ncbi:signal peptidase complex subunit Spase25 [Arctopsyche grandis]|uniref:signal peptidase complex subunit Spase25 n=1 Tax=Arctopsyche grandis TaxID=121162 RepID=UPI00406D9B20
MSKKAAPEPAKEPEFINVDKWDGSSVKNAIDDAVKNVLKNDLSCEEKYGLMDGRLTLGGLAVGVALYAVIWDYLYPFPQSKMVLIVCVSSYFVLMGILTLYTTFKEKGIFVVAKETVGTSYRVWEASSYMKKYDDKYELVLNMYDPKTKMHREATFSKSVANFIDNDGYVVNQVVENDVIKLWNSLSSEKKDK